MARIKVPEFKENEQITSDQFNEVNEAFTGFTVNGENLANEAINQSMVEDESSFSSVQSTGNDLGTLIPASGGPLKTTGCSAGQQGGAQLPSPQ